MSESVRRKDIIEFPENYKEMIEKLKEREDEQLQRIYAKRKAETEDELKEIAKKGIVTRMHRTSGEHKTVKDLTILREPKSPEVAELRTKLDKETTDLAKRVLTELPGQLSTLTKKLKGRVKPGGDGAPTA